ncbi:M23 family metallopeptidase [bacterium]|nr:M23 family metallopeptidase [bacterium]
MVLKIKNFFTISLFVAAIWFGWKAYTFFFDNKTPVIQLSGLNNEEYYCADVQCFISANKKGELSVYMDKKPLINKFKINSSNQEHPFIIPTKTVSNGKHAITLSFTDNTFKKNKTTLNKEFYIDNIPLQAAFVQPETDYKVLQGRTLHIQFQVNKKIKKAQAHALSHTYPCFPESKNSSIYETFIPVPCDGTPNEYLLSVDITDKVGNNLTLENKFQIVPFPFKKQKLHVSSKKLQEEKELGKNPAQLEQMLSELSEKSPQEKLWRGSFCTPIEIARTTCDFGTVRTTQEKGKYQHKAVDIINTPKTVIWASQNGIIALKDRFENSGKTVIIDHGWGVMSMYFHLDEFAAITVGQKIFQGNPIGTLGKTGYASGYHLHWELRLNNVAVDPMQWTKTNF